MKNSHKTTTVPFIVLSLIFLSAISIFSQPPGTLDTTFGTGGKTLVSILPNSTGNGARKAVMGANGKIFQFGTTELSTDDGRAAIAKFDANGNLDTSFGDSGTTVYNAETRFSLFYTGIVQPDGKIIAVGHADRETPTNPIGYAVIARINPNGSLDRRFGKSGIVLYQETTSEQINTYFSKVALLPDGSYLASGSLGYKMGVVKYTENGNLDSSFGDGGRVILPLDWSESWDMEIQPDGKIIIAGRIETNILDANYSDFIIARLNPNGSLDASFDGDGIKQFDITPETDYDAEIFWSLKLLADGRILAFARIGSLPLDSAVVKLNSDGSFDPSFGTGGQGFVKIDYDNRNNLARDMAVQPDGKIVLVGADGFPTNDFLIQRLKPDGAFDTGFGNQGSVTLDFGGRDQPFSALITADNKLIVAGYGAEQPRRFALARFYLTAAAQVGEVRGRAFNLLGRGIKDTVIKVEDTSNGAIQTGMTDRSGNFSITVEMNKRYKLSANAYRCVFQTPETTFDFTDPNVFFNLKANCFKTIKGF